MLGQALVRVLELNVIGSNREKENKTLFSVFQQEKKI
jgi:hypothetical protein